MTPTQRTPGGVGDGALRTNSLFKAAIVLRDDITRLDAQREDFFDIRDERIAVHRAIDTHVMKNLIGVLKAAGGG